MDDKPGDYFRQHGERGYSEKRAAKSQQQTIKGFGYGAGVEGQALIREFLPALEKRIAEDRTYGRRDHVVWQALKGVDDIETRLLYAGVTVAVAEDIAVDWREERKTSLQTELWLGRNLGQTKSEKTVKVG